MTTTTSSNDYSAKDITVLKGLEPVQLRPGMYTRTEDPHHIIQEVIDNAQDEALAGFASRISIRVKGDYIYVEDNGRGIPVDRMVKEDGTLGKAAAEVIFTELHSGGKFNKKGGGAYKFSGGLHGVGVSVTNALSLELKAVIKKNGLIHEICFENGVVVKELCVVGKTQRKSDTGTCIIVKPNPKYFGSPKVSNEFLKNYLKIKSPLLEGVELTFQYEDEEPIVWKSSSATQYFIEEMSRLNNNEVYWLSTESVATPNKNEFIWEFEHYLPENSPLGEEGEGLKLVMGILESGKRIDASYVNLIPTPHGGTHEKGLRQGLFNGLLSFMSHYNLMPSKVNLDVEDLWSKTSFLLSAKILDPEFKGQVKEALNSREAVKIIESLVKDSFELWLNERVDFAKQLASFVIENAQARAKIDAPKPMVKRTGGSTLPGKLTDCASSDNAITEMFICEGDSAGGGAKMARDKEFQAILPIRGKILNTWEVEQSKLFASETIKNIAIAIGIEPHTLDDDVDLSKLRYGKICTLCDADVDGRHIEVLVITLMMRHFPKVVLGGHLFICRAPLFRIDYPSSKKNKTKLDAKMYIQDEKELDKAIRKIKKEYGEESYKIARFKGLGEMSPEQLWETTMDPENRRLVRMQVDLDNWTEIETHFTNLMGKDEARWRKEWMEEFGNTVEVDV